jgi:hypothetical protein
VSAVPDNPPTVAVTCACGAYLEIDAKFAGQRVPCPDCQKPVEVPSLERTRTSGLALASLLVGLIGAFTLVGNIVAIVLGAIGLRSIARNPKELAGRRVALTGMVVGAVGLAISISAFFWADRLGLDGLVRELAWAGKFEHHSSLKVQDKGFALTRPSFHWGVYHLPESDSDRKIDLILVQPREDAYVTAFIHWLDRIDDFDTPKAWTEFAGRDLIKLLAGKTLTSRPPCKVHPSKVLDTKGPFEAIEMVVDVTLPGQERKFLVRLMRKQGDFRTAVVAAGTRRARFERLEAQLRSILDTLELDRD